MSRRTGRYEGELGELRWRLLAATDRLRALPPISDLEPGPPDAETGESWNALNILGHMAEFLPYWSDQLRAALRGAPIGRDEPGHALRRRAIDSASGSGEAKLRLEIDRGSARLLRLLERLDEPDLGRRLPHLQRGEITVRAALEDVLIGHLEAHLDQLSRLGGST